MNDRFVILAGLIIFLALVTSPFWYSAVAGAGAPLPELEKPTDGFHCIEDAEWMKANHMDLLNRWRDEVVRGDGQKQSYQSKEHPEDAPYEKSLTKCCLECHTMESKSNGKRSCTQCHDYANVQPRCMDCHLEPKGN